MAKRILASIFLLCFAAVAFAAGSGDVPEDYLLHSFMGYQTQLFLFKCFNFAILLYLLNRFARKPIANMLSSAAINTKETVDSAEAKRKEAEAKLAETRRKHASLEKEMAEMQKRSLAAIEEERKRMVGEAKETADKMMRQMQARIEQDVLKAKMEVRGYLVEESIRMAEKLIDEKVSSQKQKELIADYTETIKTIAPN